MNPAEWEDAIRRLQTHLGTNRVGVSNSMANVLRVSNDTNCDYSTNQPHSSTEMNVRWEEVSSLSCNFYGKGSEVEEPDGEPLEMDEEDMELERKQKELREIEERIMFKKASIALKTYEPLLLSPPSLSSNEQPVTCTGETLRDRVNLILQQRHSPSSLSQFRSPKKRMNSFRLNKDALLLEDHPLKLRVNALMKQRHYDPFVTPANMKVPVVVPPPSSQTVTSLAEEKNGSSAGFQRFLSVLNKGVDIDLLSRIVTDDSEDLALDERFLNIQSDTVRSQQSNSSTSLLGRSRTDSGERKSNPSSGDRLSLPGDEDRKSDRGDGSFASSSRSRSPPAVKKRKKEEEKPKMDEQHEHLQNILKTLGLSLEVEEMSKLADRTLERLYGKKHEGATGGADGRAEQESRQRRSQRYNRNSPSSSVSSDSDSDSSSSSSSRSNSRSFSRSPSRRSLSHGSDTRRRRAPERSSKDGQTHKDDNEEGKEAHVLREKDKGECPYPLDRNYSHPHPAAFSSFPNYNLPLYPQYSAYHRGTYSSDINSSLAYTQGVIPPSVNHSWSPYPPGSAVPNVVYPHHDPFEDINLLVNPDLSTSEGQTGAAGSRCLRVISTKPVTNQRCVTQLTKSYKRKAKYIRKCRAWFEKLKKRKKMNKMTKQPVLEVQRRSQRIAERMAQLASQQEKDVPETQQTKEEKRELTEEEIKANLRKKLEAFNQRVKQQVTPPAAAQSSHTELH